MKNGRAWVLFSIVAAVAAACSSSSSGTGTTTPDSIGTTTAGYDTLAADVAAAAGHYHDDMAGTGMASATDCQHLHDAYDETVRPKIAQMMQMGPPMDDFMGQHGGADHEDVTCGAATMMNELDHHRLVACTAATLDDDRAEASRHVGAILGYCNDARERCGQIAAGLDGGAWGWGPMMNGCHGFLDGGHDDDWWHDDAGHDMGDHMDGHM